MSDNKFIKIIVNMLKILCFLIVIMIGIIIFDCTIGTNISGQTVTFFVNLGHKERGEEVEDIQISDIIQKTLSRIEGSSSEYNNVDYSNVKVDKYFFNQLEDEAKNIYKAFESNKEEMKTGTAKIELGSSCSNVLAKENGQEELGKYFQSAIEAYTYDNPDVFYLSLSKMFLNIETTTRGKKVTYNVFINSGNEENYLTKEFKDEDEVDEAIKRINNVRQAVLENKQDNVYDNIKMVHDYLVDTIEYDNGAVRSNTYNIYGALVNNECVCEGYAKSFKYLMDALDIPCTLVIGKAKNSAGAIENHAWNYVQIDDKWYAVDCTWDDPVIIGFGSVDKTRKYKYFLVGENEINKDHMPNGQFTEGGKVFEYPELSIENYK